VAIREKKSKAAFSFTEKLQDWWEFINWGVAIAGS